MRPAVPESPRDDRDEAIVDLEARVNELSDRVRRQKWLLTLAAAGSILTLVLAVIVVQRVNQSTEQKFCAVLGVQSGTPAPPTTEQRVVLAAIEKLYRDLGCVQTIGPPIVATTPEPPSSR